MNIVKKGQIWKDNDKRVGDRFLEIMEIQNDYVFAKVCLNGVWKTRQTRVKLSRFKPVSTGYILVKDC